LCYHLVVVCAFGHFSGKSLPLSSLSRRTWKRSHAPHILAWRAVPGSRITPTCTPVEGQSADECHERSTRNECLCLTCSVLHCWVYSDNVGDVPDLSPRDCHTPGGPRVCLHVAPVGIGAFILGKEGISLVRVGIGMVVIAPPVIVALAMMSRQIITPTKLMAEAAAKMRLASLELRLESRAKTSWATWRCLSTHDSPTCRGWLPQRIAWPG